MTIIILLGGLALGAMYKVMNNLVHNLRSNDKGRLRWPKTYLLHFDSEHHSTVDSVYPPSWRLNREETILLQLSSSDILVLDNNAEVRSRFEPGLPPGVTIGPVNSGCHGQPWLSLGVFRILYPQIEERIQKFFRGLRDLRVDVQDPRDDEERLQIVFVGSLFGSNRGFQPALIKLILDEAAGQGFNFDADLLLAHPPLLKGNDEEEMMMRRGYVGLQECLAIQDGQLYPVGPAFAALDDLRGYLRFIYHCSGENAYGSVQDITQGLEVFAAACASLVEPKSRARGFAESRRDNVKMLAPAAGKTLHAATVSAQIWFPAPPLRASFEAQAASEALQLVVGKEARPEEIFSLGPGLLSEFNLAQWENEIRQSLAACKAKPYAGFVGRIEGVAAGQLEPILGEAQAEAEIELERMTNELVVEIRERTGAQVLDKGLSQAIADLDGLLQDMKQADQDQGKLIRAVESLKAKLKPESELNSDLQQAKKEYQTALNSGPGCLLGFLIFFSRDREQEAARKVSQAMERFYLSTLRRSLLEAVLRLYSSLRPRIMELKQELIQSRDRVTEAASKLQASAQLLSKVTTPCLSVVLFKDSEREFWYRKHHESQPGLVRSVATAWLQKASSVFALKDMESEVLEEIVLSEVTRRQPFDYLLQVKVYDRLVAHYPDEIERRNLIQGFFRRAQPMVRMRDRLGERPSRVEVLLHPDDPRLIKLIDSAEAEVIPTARHNDGVDFELVVIREIYGVDPEDFAWLKRAQDLVYDGQERPGLSSDRRLMGLEPLLKIRGKVNPTDLAVVLYAHRMVQVRKGQYWLTADGCQESLGSSFEEAGVRLQADSRLQSIALSALAEAEKNLSQEELARRTTRLLQNEGAKDGQPGRGGRTGPELMSAFRSRYLQSDLAKRRSGGERRKS